MKKTYYLYAGYYELHISAHELGKPFVLVSKHRKFDRVINAAEKFDDDACKIFYKDTASEYCKYLGHDNDDLFRDEISFCVADAEEIEYPDDYDDSYKPKYKWFDMKNPYKKEEDVQF